MLRRPIAVLAVAYAAGIVFERYYPVQPSLLYAGAICMLAGALVCVFMRWTAVGTGAVVVLMSVLGSLAYAPFQTVPRSVRLLEPWLHTPVVVEGIVKRVEHRTPGGPRLTMRYDSIENPVEQCLAGGRMLLSLKETEREYYYGQRLRFNCRLRRPRNFSNPGGFDYERYLAHRGIYVTTFLRDDRRVLVLREDAGNPLMGMLERYRSQLRHVICERLASPARDLTLALLLGEKRNLDPEIKERFARLGVAHLLAISGLHIGIVAALSFGTACFVLRLCPRILLFVDLWKAAALISCIPVFLYSCIAGLQLPTLRACIMIAVCVTALLINRRQDVCNPLALAFFIILIWRPASLFEVSFQLSFCAVFVLILCAVPVGNILGSLEAFGNQCRRRWCLRLYRFLGGIFSASLIAAFATAPFTALYFQNVALAGMLANCLLVPAIGFVAVPCVLIFAAVFPLSETGALWFLHAGGVVLDQALLWIEFWADVPMVSVFVSPPSPSALGAYFCLLLFLLFGGRKRRPAAALILCALIAVLWARKPGEPPGGLLRVTFLDVGHGDAAIIQFPRGRVMLIDSGGLRSDHFDTGKSIVAPALAALGVRRVAWLVISHPHHDHMAGMTYIAEHFKPKELWTPTRKSFDALYRRFIGTARQQGIQVLFPSRDTKPFCIDGVTITFLSPTPHQAETVRSYSDVNNSSLVMKLSYGRHSFLFTGDIGAQQEQVLLGLETDLRARILKVPHHGTRGSGTPAFLDAVNPDNAVISCRPYSGRGIPDDVLNRYRLRGIDVLRTDTHGAIKITSNGIELTTYTFLPHRRFMPCETDAF